MERMNEQDDGGEMLSPGLGTATGNTISQQPWLPALSLQKTGLVDSQSQVGEDLLEL